MDDNVKKEYEVLQKKYKLPSLDDLQKTFMFTNIETCNPLLTGVRVHITEKIDYFLSLLQEFLNPDTEITNIYEYKSLDEKSKLEIFNIYKRMMAYSRQSNILFLTYDETEEAVFIKNVYNNWSDISKILKKHLLSLQKEWEKKETSPPKEIIDYWG